MIPIPQFSPKNSLAGVVAGLFQNNEPGVWYDPSDFSTMFQDAAGTTPVTAVEQPVGLMLDKSKGLVLGPELVTNGDFSNGTTGWTAIGGGAISVTGGVATFSSGVDNSRTAEQAITTVAGRWYQVTVDVTSLSAGTQSLVAGTSSGGSQLYSSFTNVIGRRTAYFLATGTTTYIGWNCGNTSRSAIVDNISVREIPGNHAYQTTTTSRPVLSARYNLLTKTEQFDDAVWVKSNATVTANATTAPDGTTTADLLYPLTTGSDRRVISASINLGVSLHTVSAYIKAAGKSWAYMLVPQANTINDVVWFDLANGVVGTTGSAATSASIQSVGNSWYRCSVTGLSDAASVYSINVADSNGSTTVTANGTDGIYIWGASLVPANQAHIPYQRVNTTTDYDSDPAKFKPYLVFDGIDDWLVTNTVTPEIDKVQVFAVVRKLSDVSAGAVVELSTSLSSTAGSFGLFAPPSANARLAFGTGGTSDVFAETGSVYPAPLTPVLTAFGDISGDSATLRINGTQAAINIADQGTGNYGNYPLYIGRRGGTTLPFNGHLYSLIVRFGNNLPIETIEKTEEYINLKTAAIDWRDITDSSSFRWNSATASPDAE